MEAIEAVLQTLPEHSSDLSANVLELFTQSKLTPARLWGTAIASAVATRAPALVAAVESDAVAAGVSADVIEDARAAASLTSMNNIYYRFRHFMRDEERPKAEKLDFELYGVAVSSINGCELCVRVRMHADAVVKGGLLSMSG